MSSYAATDGKNGVALTVKLSIASGCGIVHDSVMAPSRAWTTASVAGATGYRHTPPMSAVLPVHAAHTVRFAEEPSPTAHGVHEGEPAEAETLPGGHTEHASPEDDDEPAGQAAHVGSPGPSVTHPPATATKLTVRRAVGEEALGAKPAAHCQVYNAVSLSYAGVETRPFEVEAAHVVPVAAVYGGHE